MNGRWQRGNSNNLSGLLKGVYLNTYEKSLANLFARSYCKNSLKRKLNVLRLKSLAYWEFLHAFLSSADFFFQKSTFSKNYFRNTIKVPNSLDTDRAWRFVGPDPGPNCLQSLSTDDTSRQSQWLILGHSISWPTGELTKTQISLYFMHSLSIQKKIHKSKMLRQIEGWLKTSFVSSWDEWRSAI